LELWLGLVPRPIVAQHSDRGSKDGSSRGWQVHQWGFWNVLSRNLSIRGAFGDGDLPYIEYGQTDAFLHAEDALKVAANPDIRRHGERVSGLAFAFVGVSRSLRFQPELSAQDWNRSVNGKRGKANVRTLHERPENIFGFRFAKLMDFAIASNIDRVLAEVKALRAGPRLRIGC
jgi:hypothetical protein